MVTVFSTIVIDPNPIFRDGLERLLASSMFEVIARCSDLSELNAIRVESGSSLAVLVGLGEDRPACFDAVRHIRARFPLAKIILLSDSLMYQDWVEGMEAGANSLLLKTLSPSALMQLVELAMRGQHIFLLTRVPDNFIKVPSETLEISDAFPGRPTLSQRQAEILARLKCGESNKMIARVCNISEETVKVHIRAILQKINVRNRTEAAMWAFDNDVQVSRPRQPMN